MLDQIQYEELKTAETLFEIRQAFQWELVVADLALTDSIAWQIAKDEGEDDVTLDVWERACMTASTVTSSV